MREEISGFRGVAGVRGRARFWTRMLRYRYRYLALLPAVGFLVVFEWYPALSAFYHSLFMWNGGSLHVFVGLQNFANLLQDRMFLRGLRNLALFVAFRVVFQVVVPFIAAELIVNLKSARWAEWWKIILVFPMVVPHVLMYLIWRFVYNPQLGVINQGLQLLGLGNWTHAWLSDPHLSLWALSFVRFPWLATLQFLIILGGLQAIPKEIADSAKIDGANWRSRILHIDLPMARNQIVLAMILTAIFMTQRFDLFLVMTDGGPGIATMVPALQLYHSAFNDLDFGYASAIGVVMFVIMLGLTVLNLRFGRSGGGK